MIWKSSVKPNCPDVICARIPLAAVSSARWRRSTTNPTNFASASWRASSLKASRRPRALASSASSCLVGSIWQAARACSRVAAICSAVISIRACWSCREFSKPRATTVVRPVSVFTVAASVSDRESSRKRARSRAAGIEDGVSPQAQLADRAGRVRRGGQLDLVAVELAARFTRAVRSAPAGSRTSWRIRPSIARTASCASTTARWVLAAVRSCSSASDRRVASRCAALSRPASS